MHVLRIVSTDTILHFVSTSIILLCSSCLDPPGEKNPTAAASPEGEGGEVELSSQAVVAGILDDLINKAVEGKKLIQERFTLSRGL